MRMTIYCDDEALFRYADSRSADAAFEAHLASCRRCTDELRSQREIMGALRKAETWTSDANAAAMLPGAASPLSRLAEAASLSKRLREEDADAQAVCELVLTGPAAWWSNRFRNLEFTPTAGIVRQLLERMRPLLVQSPKNALHVTTLAIDVANRLLPGDYPAAFLSTLRAQALRDHAFVLAFLGRFPDALGAAEKSEELFLRTNLPEFELARLDLVKAHIYRGFDRTDEAIALTHRSSETFLRFGDRKRYVEARNTEAAYVYESGNVRQALDMWRSIQPEAALAGESMPSRVLMNMGICYGELEQWQEAERCLEAAMDAFERLGMQTELVRCRWTLGSTLLVAERYEDAVLMLARARREFAILGMEADAAMVGLELAEAMLESGEAEQVPGLCEQLVAAFSRISMSSGADQAIALLRDAAARPSTDDVRRVRKMLAPIAAAGFRSTRA